MNNNNNLIHKKSLKYLREQNIIKDDEEISDKFLLGLKGETLTTSAPKVRAKYNTGLLTFIMALILLMLFGLQGVEIPDSYVGYGVILCCLIMGIFYYFIAKIKYAIRKITPPTTNKENQIAQSLLRFSSNTNTITQKSDASAGNYLMGGLVVAVFTARLFSYNLNIAFFAVIIFFLPLVMFYKATLTLYTIREKIHFLITSNKLYFNHDITQEPYTIIDIDDVNHIEIITVKTYVISYSNIRSRSTRYYYCLRFIKNNENILNVEVSKDLLDKGLLTQLFPNTELRFIKKTK